MCPSVVLVVLVALLLVGSFVGALLFRRPRTASDPPPPWGERIDRHRDFEALAGAYRC